MSDEIKALRAELDALTEQMKTSYIKMAHAMIEGKNQTEAYVEAGGKAKDPYAGASEMLKLNPNISQYVDLAKKIASLEAVDHLEVTEARITRELAKIGFFNIKKLYAKDGRLLEPHELDDDTAGAVTEIEETILRTDSETGDQTIKRKYKMGDKKGALQLLGNTRAIQMFRENIGVEDPEKKLTEAQLNARIAELQRKAGAGEAT